MLDYPTILAVVESFYETAKKDVMIGYHFRFIKDFDEHIPRIADFWHLQLNGKVTKKENLPFKLLEVHIPLKVRKGEIFRWEKLFNENLEGLEKISEEDKLKWREKVIHFRNILIQKLF